MQHTIRFENVQKLIGIELSLAGEPNAEREKTCKTVQCEKYKKVQSPLKQSVRFYVNVQLLCTCSSATTISKSTL